MANEVERLLRYIRREDVALFIGSGFSIKAGAPSVWDLIEAINKAADTDLAKVVKSPTLRSITEIFVEEYGDRNELLSILKNLFSFKPKILQTSKCWFRYLIYILFLQPIMTRC